MQRGLNSVCYSDSPRAIYGRTLRAQIGHRFSGNVSKTLANRGLPRFLAARKPKYFNGWKGGRVV
jgi:hypothetical protein